MVRVTSFLLTTLVATAAFHPKIDESLHRRLREKDANDVFLKAMRFPPPAPMTVPRVDTAPAPAPVEFSDKVSEDFKKTLSGRIKSLWR